MHLNIFGQVKVELENEIVVFEASDFEMAEDGYDEDYNYNALYINNHPEHDTQIRIQISESQGQVKIYDASLDGDGKIVEEALSAKIGAQIKADFH